MKAQRSLGGPAEVIQVNSGARDRMEAVKKGRIQRVKYIWEAESTELSDCLHVGHKTERNQRSLFYYWLGH